MLHYKLQIGCLIIILYMVIMYYYAAIKSKEYKTSMFDIMLAGGISYLIFDMITVYTVNHLDTVPDILNRICHAIFLMLLDLEIFLLFYYIAKEAGILPRKRKYKLFVIAPFLVNEFVIAAAIGKLEFRHGEITNYSMGIPAYTCYVMVMVYFIATIIVYARSWKYIAAQKRISAVVYLIAAGGICIYQMLVPQALVSSLAVTVSILCMYFGTKNPAYLELEKMYDRTVHSFADIIESRDGSTGEHVKRTTAYVELMVNALSERNLYTSILTADYKEALVQAAPLHDIGKIAIPDAILQKPGRLTKEEFEIMKTHTVQGEKIIQTSLSHLGNSEASQMAAMIAKCHHEKWDGTGYPCGLKGEEIPLGARIMAVADVFDAVSEKRCYREAMSIEESFAIIRDGAGTSFEPLLAELFCELRGEVLKIHSHAEKV